MFRARVNRLVPALVELLSEGGYRFSRIASAMQAAFKVFKYVATLLADNHSTATACCVVNFPSEFRTARFAMKHHNPRAASPNASPASFLPSTRLTMNFSYKPLVLSPIYFSSAPAAGAGSVGVGWFNISRSKSGPISSPVWP